jgi:leader peptidase (prepilin peptidase) / N-methyltransferase
VTNAQTLPGVDTFGRIAATFGLGLGVEGCMVWRFGWSAVLPAFLYFGAVATVVSATDATTRLVPNRVVLPAYLVGPALLVVASLALGRWSSLARAGLAMAILASLFVAMALVSRGGIGFGDCKWAGIIGLYLGWLGWQYVVTGVLLSYLGAAVVVIVIRIVRKSGDSRLLPFAPFMAGGAVVAMVYVK